MDLNISGTEFRNPDPKSMSGRKDFPNLLHRSGFASLQTKRKVQTLCVLRKQLSVSISHGFKVLGVTLAAFAHP